jgi:hypothetical protein
LEHLANIIIIQIHQAGFIHYASKDELHQMFKHCQSIPEAAGQNCKLPKPVTGGERCLLFITGMLGHLLVATLQVRVENHLAPVAISRMSSILDSGK